MVYIFLGGGFILVLILIVMYNKMVTRKNHMQEAWSIIDVFLKKRYDLIPNLWETVKGYTKHENETLAKIVLLRTEAMQSKNRLEKIDSENKLSGALANVVALSENYPELKASSFFLQLQSQLSDIENNLEKARRYYNGTVRENNILIESFPSNLIANLFLFQKGYFFQIEEEENKRLTVSF